MRSIVKISGGKSYLKKFITSIFPHHNSYLELFGGAASVLLHKTPCPIEVYNDLDVGLYNMFNALRNHPHEMINSLRKIEYNEESFKEALERKKVDEVGKATDEIVIRRMSRGGMMKHFSWSTRLRGGQFGDVNAWNTYLLALPEICHRLSKVAIQNLSFEQAIGEYDLIYCDPPYMPESRTPNLYKHEMTVEDHKKLAGLLLECKSKVVLSGYRTDLYDKWYKDWHLIMKEMPNHASQTKKKNRRIECLWVNYHV